MFATRARGNVLARCVMGCGKFGAFTALYNHGKCADHALRSTLSQKCVPGEVMVIDREATDDFTSSAQAIDNPLICVISDRYRRRNTIWVRQ